jgi:hypothetical protein
MQRTEAFIEGSYKRRRIWTFRKSFANFDQRSVGDGIFTPMNSKLKFFSELGRCLFWRMTRLGISSSVRNYFFWTLGAASEKESISTNSFSELDGQCSRKLNLYKGQRKEPFWLGSVKRSSSKVEGTRRTSEETTFLIAFLASSGSSEQGWRPPGVQRQKLVRKIGACILTIRETLSSKVRHQRT